MYAVYEFLLRPREALHPRPSSPLQHPRMAPAADGDRTDPGAVEETKGRRAVRLTQEAFGGLVVVFVVWANFVLEFSALSVIIVGSNSTKTPIPTPHHRPKRSVQAADSVSPKMPPQDHIENLYTRPCENKTLHEVQGLSSRPCCKCVDGRRFR